MGQGRSNVRVSALGICIVAVSLAGFGAAQQRTPLQMSRLMSVVDVIKVESFARTDWELMADETAGYEAKTHEQAENDINSFAKAAVTTNERRGLVAEHGLFLKYRRQLVELTGRSTRPFLYTETPVRFALKDDVALTLVITSLSSNSVYNTLQLDAKHRAAREIQMTILPALRQFGSINMSEVRNFGISVVYGTRDFSEEDSTNTRKAEAVTLVADAARCSKLSKAELSEEEFVSASDVYLVERGPRDEVRKIKISLGDEK